MKRHLLFALSIFALTFASCNGDDVPGINPGVTVSFDLEFGYDGGAKPITVTETEGLVWDVEVVEGSDWVAFEKTEKGFMVNVASNRTADLREAKLAVTAEGIDDVIVTVKQIGRTVVGANFVLSQGSYWGDYYEVGYGNWTLNLYNEYCQLSGGWLIYGDGAIVLGLDLFADEPADKNVGYPSGTYTISDGMERFTAFGLVEYLNVDGVHGEFAFADGETFTIENDGNNYVITFDNVILSNGMSFSATYSGFIDVQHAMYPTFLTKDVNFGTISEGGDLYFAGDFLGNGTYVWQAQMWGEGIYIEGQYFKGTGTIIDVAVLSDQSSTAAIPAGTYALSTAREAGKAVHIKYVELENDGLVGEAALYQGNVTITRNGDSYRIAVDAEDYPGNRVTGAYEGKLVYNDATEAPQEAKIHSVWTAPKFGQYTKKIEKQVFNK